jgi:glutaminyl-peptide cyclotransferase
MAKKSTNRAALKKASRLPLSRTLVVIAVIVLAVISTYLLVSRSSSGTNSEGTGNRIASDSPRAEARLLSYEVVNSYPHDRTSFTQGLVWSDGGFYESTGQYGSSKLRRLEFPSAHVAREINLSPDLFGEGLALIDNRLIQLTWKSHRGFVYNRDTFQLIREFSYDTEGWGLTCDGTNLILSDGSSDLFYIDPTSFKVIRKLSVKLNDRPIRELNELEFIEGEIWANVWQTDLILRIDPQTGSVNSYLDLKGILAPSDRGGVDAVLNGIAYDPQTKRIFITGKLWPRIFEIRVKN